MIITGELIYVFGNAFHTVSNKGPNLAESRNFASLNWLDEMLGYRPCVCAFPNTFRLPLEDLQLIDPEEYKRFYPNKYDPLRADKMLLMEIAIKSNNQEFLDGVESELVNDIEKLPHYATVMMKMNQELVKNKDAKEGHALQEFEKNDEEKEAEEESEESGGEITIDEKEVSEEEHDYKSCKKCGKELSAQTFHGHLAKFKSCKISYLREFSMEKFNVEEFEWEDENLEKSFRDFVNDDRKRVSRMKKKSLGELKNFKKCSFCKRSYLRMGSHDSSFLGCKMAKKDEK